MFNALFRRAQVTVDHAIGHAINRVIVAIPFIVAAAFCTAALTIRLMREFGPELGLTVMAILYVVLGLICAAFMLRTPAQTAAEVELEVATPEVQATMDTAGASTADRELVAAALTSIAPLALPSIIRLLLKNLPLLTALAALFFIVTREAPVEDPVATT